jgi:hypothetical protein
MKLVGQDAKKKGCIKHHQKFNLNPQLMDKKQTLKVSDKW